MSVGSLLAATIGLLLALAVMGIGLALLASGELGRERALLLDQVGPSVQASLSLENALVNQETGVRGFALTGEPRFLEPYREGLDAEARALAGLRSHERAIGMAVATDVEGVARRVGAWRRSYVAPTLARPPTPRRRHIAAEVQGKHLFDSVRASLGRLLSGLLVENARVRGRLNGAAANLEALLIVAAALILGGVLAAGVLLRSAITRPLARLGAEARRVAGGEYSTPLDAGDGAREIAEVGQEIDAMRRRIVEELASAQAARGQLEEQALKLRRSNAELEQFAYVASHDLQEPLRKIASFCQALQQRYRGRLDERADQYIDFAVDGAKRMQVLINDLLAFSRVGHSGRERELVELDEALADARASLSAALERSRASIEHDALPAVLGDRAQLASLFQNLISNAVKFRSQAPPRVRIVAARGDRMWELSLQDNGIGIDPEYAERIFLIFQRLHTRDSYEGSGIGLALCRKIVEYHGGRIWLDPDHREGARFRFTLPIAKEA
jgi:signal transduction histidine kinase